MGNSKILFLTDLHVICIKVNDKRHNMFINLKHCDWFVIFRKHIKRMLY